MEHREFFTCDHCECGGERSTNCCIQNVQTYPLNGWEDDNEWYNKVILTVKIVKLVVKYVHIVEYKLTKCTQ